MNALIYLGKWVLDCIIAVSAVGIIMWFWQWMSDRAENRWRVEVPVTDPVQVHVWEVLEEARRITESAAGGTDAAG